MIAKLNNGVISYAPKKYTFANPDPEMLKQYAGFKEYVEEEKPKYDPSTQKLIPEYTEDENTIICKYKVEEISKDEQYISQEERITNLENTVDEISNSINKV